MRYSREGTIYDLNQISMYGSNTRPGWYAVRSDVTQVIFDPSFGNALPSTTHEWFTGMYNLESITGIEYLNTRFVQDMDYMFNNCSKLTSIDLSHFNTTNVINMNYMFSGCRRLTNLDLSSFNGNKLKNTSYMFNNCTGLTSLDLGGFNTSNVTDMSYMFYGCTGLTSLDLSTFNTSNVTKMGYMFYGCTGLTSLDLSNFNTSSAANMSYMFYGCTGLTSLDLSNFSLPALVSTITHMFYGCSELTTIYANKEWKVNSMTDSNNMFRNCTKLVGGMGTTYDPSHINYLYARIDMGPSLPGYFTEKTPVEAYVCYTPDNTTLTFYYDGQRGSRPGTTYDLNVGNNQPDWVIDGTSESVTQAVFDPSFADARPTSTLTWFYAMHSLQSIAGIEYLNTDSVTTMASMFIGCSSLTSLDVSHFNTEMTTSMSNMFDGCSGLTSIDLSNFNTDNVIAMTAMFRGCQGLTSLDVSHFNTEKVDGLGDMFMNCSSLKSLDLSNFNTDLVMNMNRTFFGCSQLTTIYASESWSMKKVIFANATFYDCTSLVGGMGTTYDFHHIGIDYAHIDGGPSNPGYFTDKNGGLRGDVNGNGIVNISDVTDLISLLLGNGTISNQAADCNQDSNVNISDVTALISYLLSGTW